jgi:pilus assembly protein CpaF
MRGEWSPELLTALAPIAHLLRDETITDIAVNACNDVWTKGAGWRGWRREDAPGWDDLDDFRVACIRVSDVIGRPVNERKPLLNARLPGGERVNVVVPPACARIALTIRKFPAETMTLDRLERLGTLAHGDRAGRAGELPGDLEGAGPGNGGAAGPQSPLRAICESLVLARVSMIVAGGTNAGKTSLLNALSRVIPAHERIVTIEDARELQMQQPNWVALETVEPVEREERGVSTEDLVRNALRMTPDRIVVGEVRGDDALHLLRALSTGHRGGFGTVHASSAVDALVQLQVLAQMASTTMQPQVVAALVSRAVDVVVYQELFEDEGKRRVSQVVEVDRPGVRFEAGGIEYLVRELVKWDDRRGTWVYPHPPSEGLRKALRRVGRVWPGGLVETAT